MRHDEGGFDFTNQPGLILNKQSFVSGSSPLVSIITPYYNGGRYFRQTYNSVMNQTFTQFEWIIVNDGSADIDSVKLLSNLQESDERIRVLSKENGGIASAQNVGIIDSKTDYILPLDADDLIEPEYIETLYNALEKYHDCTFAYTNTVIFQGRETLHDCPFDVKFIKVNNTLTKTALFRKSSIDAVGGYYEGEKHFNEDWHLWLKLFSRSCYPVKVNRYGFWYRYVKSGVRSIVKSDPIIAKRNRKLISEAAKTVDTSITARVIGKSIQREKPLRKLARVASHNPFGAYLISVVQRFRKR